MTIDELKAKVESHRAVLREGSEYTSNYYERGAVSMVLIDALVSALETQEHRIVALERAIAGK